MKQQFTFCKKIDEFASSVACMRYLNPLLATVKPYGYTKISKALKNSGSRWFRKKSRFSEIKIVKWELKISETTLCISQIVVCQSYLGPTKQICMKILGSGSLINTFILECRKNHKMLLQSNIFKLLFDRPIFAKIKVILSGSFCM